MTTPQSPSTASNPNLPTEEIGRRFLKLIEQLESRNDLSVDGIQSVLGVTLEHVQVPNENLDYYAYVQKLDSKWSFSIHYNPASPGLKEGIGLNFNYSEVADGRMQTACFLDFNHYHDALVAMGFLAEPHYGEIGELRSWRYTKFKESDGTVDMTISIIPQNVLVGKVGGLCVKSISTLN